MLGGRHSGVRLLAWAAAAVGLLGIGSALTPELASRIDLVKGILPPGTTAAARVLALAFGIALLWLSRSLARRQRRAWQLAVVLAVAISAAHLAKGLDFEEATASVVLLAALLRYRGHFDVPGDPEARRPLALTAAAVTASAGLTVYAGLRGHDRLSDLLTAVALVLGFRALQLWLRPVRERVRQTLEQRRLARAVLRAEGGDSLAFFALRHDKSWFFSPTRRSFLAYRVVAGAALVSGDPIGPEEELDALAQEFRRVAHARGWRLAVLGAGPAHVARWRRLGLRAIKLGDEALLRPQAFSLEGRPIRKVRQSVARLERAGYRVRVVGATEVSPALRRELDAVSEEWRGNHPERGFSMAMDDLFGEPAARFAVAEEGRGSVGGFLHLVPSSDGYSLGTMRRRPGTPNGLMEFLIVRTLGWARAEGARELSLNFCVFSDLVRPQEARALARRALRTGLKRLDRLFQLERLHAFGRKFLPEWRPRYVCVERLADVPLVALAYLHLEQLLVPPGPWARPRGQVAADPRAASAERGRRVRA